MRKQEADEFYAELIPARYAGRRGSSDAPGLRRHALDQAVLPLRRRPLARRRPDRSRRRRSRAVSGRNARWRHFDAYDIMSMPDTWEYPWFAAWDLAFHCVALAHVDPAFAKYQLLLLCREWFMHPNGALPAYEWAFDDVNPPVQAWAALEVFAIDGAEDIDFLGRVFDKLLVNFTWWVNREDADGSQRLRGRASSGSTTSARSIAPPAAGDSSSSPTRTGVDGASTRCTWRRSRRCSTQHGEPTRDLTVKFLEHFALIRDALDEQGLWDDEDGFFYDRLG